MENTTLVIPLVIIIPLVFVGMWCGVVLLLSRVGGWHRLAQRFADSKTYDGPKYFLQTVLVGVCHYKGVMTLQATNVGLKMSLPFLFRCGHPDLLIPWEEMHHLRQEKLFWLSFACADIGSPVITTLKFPEHVLANTELAEKLL